MNSQNNISSLTFLNRTRLKKKFFLVAADKHETTLNVEWKLMLVQLILNFFARCQLISQTWQIFAHELHKAVDGGIYWFWKHAPQEEGIFFNEPTFNLLTFFFVSHQNISNIESRRKCAARKALPPSFPPVGKQAAELQTRRLTHVHLKCDMFPQQQHCATKSPQEFRRAPSRQKETTQKPIAADSV